MPDPEISIVIVSWNVRDHLIACLRSIVHFVRTPYEIIVVDNHSSDDSVPAVRQGFPSAIVIDNAENFGFARANNQGWQRARGQYVFFLNPDTELINDPFPAMVDYCRQHPRAGCLGPELVNPDRSHQPSVRRFPRFLDQALVLLKLRRLSTIFAPLRSYLADPGDMSRDPEAVDQIMGAAMFCPQAALAANGTFDEGYWIWFEEVDFCRRLQQQGFDVIYFPRARVIHRGGQSFSQHLSLAKQIWFMRSLGRYARKHWSRPAVIGIYALMPLSYLLTVVQSFFKPK